MNNRCKHSGTALAVSICVVRSLSAASLYWSGVGQDASLQNAANWSPAQPPASGDLLYWNGQQSGALNLTYSGAFGGANGVRLFLATNQAGSVSIALVDTASRVFRLATSGASTLDGGMLTLDGQDATVRAVFELGTAATGQTVTFNNNSTNTATFGEYTTIRKNSSATTQSITFRGSGTVRILGQINNLGGAGSVGVRTGRLLLEGTSLHTGNIDAESGIMEFTRAAAIGSAGNRIKLGQGDISGTLKYSGDDDVAIERQIAIGNGSDAANIGAGTINASGAGKLVFSAIPFNADATQSPAIARTLTLAGHSQADNEIQGAIRDNAAGTAAVALAKEGGGTWILSGTNTFSGATRVGSGLLVVEGDHSAATGTVTVANGAALGGGGTLGGSLFFDYGAQFRFAPDATLTVNGRAVGLGNLGVADLVGLDGSVAAGSYLLIDGSASFDFCSVRNLGAAHAHGLGGGKIAYFQKAGGLQLVVLPPSVLDAQLLPDGSSLSLEWWGEAGVPYGMEATDDLVLGAWGTVASNLVGTGGWLGFTGSVSSAQSHYRLTLQTAAPDKQLQRWYEDNNLGMNGGVPLDFVSRLDDVSSWEESLKTMDGFGMASSSYNIHLKTNDVLSTRIGEVLGAYGIPACINSIAATWAHYYGYDLSYPTTKNMLTRFRNWGWNIQSIALQSVLSKPLPAGQGSYSMSNRVADVVTFFQAIRPLHPHIKIGIIDALPAKGKVSGPDGYQAAYQQLKDGLAEAGYALDFIMMDYPIDFALTGMVSDGFQHTFEAMVEVERYIEQVIGCPAILMLTSRRGGHESADLWRSDVLDGLQGYLDAGGSPHHVYLNAWYPYPEWSAPDEPDPAINPNGVTMLGTFRLVDGILRAHEANNL